MAIISDMIYGTNLIPGVVPKLNYKSDVVQNVPRWIVTAIRYITDNYPFEELSTTGPLVSLQFNLADYPITDFLYPNALKVTRFDSFVLFLGPYIGGASNPSIELKWRSVKVVRQLSYIISQPIIYTIYGTDPVGLPGIYDVMIAMSPGRAYQVQASYQMKHPFIDGMTDQILLPDAWLEVVANVAALIGAEENRMIDKMQTLRSILYGDPENPRKPGLINALVSSRSQFSNVNERQLNMISEL